MEPINAPQARADLQRVADAGLSTPAYNPEHALHELSHAVLLGLTGPHGVSITTPLGRDIGDAIMKGSMMWQDWHEVRVCAVELRTAMLIRFEEYDARGGRVVIDAAGVLAGNTIVMDPKVAEARIDVLVWAESTYMAARKVVDAIGRTARALRRNESGAVGLASP